MGDWSSWIGRRQVSQDMLTSGLLSRFRATIDSAATGDVAPQAIHWALCPPDTATADLDDDGHPRRTADTAAFLPPLPLPRRMWAASNLRFLAPLRTGTAIERQSVITDISEKHGSSGPLIFVQIAHDILADGQLAIQELQTIVYRAIAAAPSAMPPQLSPPDYTPGLADWDWHRCITPSPALLFRYSALTFNSHRIHYDAPYARDVESYPALVVHGPLSATLLLDLAARELGHNMLSRFSMQAKAPAFAGDPLHLVGKAKGRNITLAAINAAGQTIVAASAEMI